MPELAPVTVPPPDMFVGPVELKELSLEEQKAIVDARIAANIASVRGAQPPTLPRQPAAIGSDDAATTAETRDAFADMLKNDESHRRDRLALAIEARDHAAREVAAAREAVERAESHRREINLRLDRYGNLDGRISDHLAACFKNSHPIVLPSDLQSQQRERGNAVDELDAVCKAIERLRAESVVADLNLAVVEREVTLWAGAIIIAMAEAKGAELVEVEARAAVLRRELVSMASVWIAGGGTSMPLALPADVKATLTKPRPDTVVDATMVEAVRAWHARLLHNPDAAYVGLVNLAEAIAKGSADAPA